MSSGFSSGFSKGFSILDIIIAIGKRLGRSLLFLLKYISFRAIFEFNSNLQKHRDTDIEVPEQRVRLKEKAAQVVKYTDKSESHDGKDHNKEAAKQYESYYKIKHKKIKVKEEPKNYKEALDL